MKLTDNALELLECIKDTADGLRYQSVDGKIRRAAAHELETAKLAEWKGNSFGSNFYCITDLGRAVLAQQGGRE